MNSKEANELLLNAFPELKEPFIDETHWQEGIETGAHSTYEPVFVPFIIDSIKQNNKPLIIRIFSFLENSLLLHDGYLDEVIYCSVLENIVFNYQNLEYLSYCGKETLKAIETFKPFVRNI